MSKKPPSSKSDELDFESAIKELESLVERLESGELGLADSLSHFENGVRLSRQCHSLIDRARQTVEVLSDVSDENSASPLAVSDQSDDPDRNEEIPF